MRNIVWGVVLVSAGALLGCRFASSTVNPAPSAAGDPSVAASAEPASSTAGSGGVQWVTMRDAREQAFSVEVPKGWKATGGMFRYHIAYTRLTVEMTSPDGKINIQMGDPTIPNYQTPANNPYIPQRLQRMQGGPPEAAYASGEVFAGKYGLARFSSMCQFVELKGTQPRQPKFSQSAVGGYTSSTAGEATFQCTRNGEQFAGYVYAETMLVKGAWGQPANWYVTALGSYLAPVDQAQAAGAMLAHSAGTIAMNPEWAQWQKYIVSVGTAINDGTAVKNWEANQQMMARQEQWKKMMAGEVDDFNDILNGTTFTIDPSTGQKYEVPTGPGGQKWMNDQLNVVSAAMQPGPSYRPLNTISRQE